MMRELDLPVSSQAILDHFGDLVDIFVYDALDQGCVDSDRHELLATNTLMRDQSDRRRFAREIVDYTRELINR
jgi:hypothetical protein